MVWCFSVAVTGLSQLVRVSFGNKSGPRYRCGESRAFHYYLREKKLSLSLPAELTRLVHYSLLYFVQYVCILYLVPFCV